MVSAADAARGEGPSVANALPAQAGKVRRTDPRPARTRAALIAAAQRLLAEGRSDASIQQITETAAVGFGSFYNHFTDKPELWGAAVSATLRAHGDLIRSLTDGMDDPAEVFCVGLRLTGRLQRRFPQLARVLANTGVAQIVADTGGILAHLRRDLAAAGAAGRFDIDVDLAVHLTAGAQLGLIAMLDADPDLDADALADEHATRMLRACGLTKSNAARLVARPLPHLTAVQ